MSAAAGGWVDRREGRTLLRRWCDVFEQVFVAR